MKLTEDDFKIDGNYLVLYCSEKKKQQILDDYEKARKWDKFVNNGKGTASEEYYYQQNQKLREWLETKYAELMDVPNRENNKLAYEIQKLLEESKK